MGTTTPDWHPPNTFRRSTRSSAWSSKPRAQATAPFSPESRGARAAKTPASHPRAKTSPFSKASSLDLDTDASPSLHPPTHPHQGRDGGPAFRQGLTSWPSGAQPPLPTLSLLPGDPSPSPPPGTHRGKGGLRGAGTHRCAS